MAAQGRFVLLLGCFGRLLGCSCWFAMVFLVDSMLGSVVAMILGGLYGDLGSYYGDLSGLCGVLGGLWQVSIHV